MKKLYRNSRDGKLGGVCAGLGDYFNIDPVIIRLGFIFLLFTGSLIAYFIAWIIVPEK